MDCAEHDMPAPPLHYCAARLSIHSIAALGTNDPLAKADDRDLAALHRVVSAVASDAEGGLT